ncbi:MAG: DUF3499 domain-containing protein [Gordonia sp. (in: high G+C Gram-positive bacteria)]
MNSPRQCCRPGCSRLAVATLTFVYAESTAVIGPLTGADEPHSWDLCSDHADRITVPRGWEMLRSEREFIQPAEDQDLTVLAEAVREAGGAAMAPRTGFSAPADIDDVIPGRHRRADLNRPELPRLPRRDSVDTVRATGPRPGRRGHLRVLPDPVD